MMCESCGPLSSGRKVRSPTRGLDAVDTPTRLPSSPSKVLRSGGLDSVKSARKVST